MSGVIDNMQFGFMPGKGTTDPIFIMRQLQEKHQANKKKMYYYFVDLEKAFDRLPREVVRWALRKLGVDDLAELEIDREDVHDRKKW